MSNTFQILCLFLLESYMILKLIPQFLDQAPSFQYQNRLREKNTPSKKGRPTLPPFWVYPICMHSILSLSRLFFMSDLFVFLAKESDVFLVDYPQFFASNGGRLISTLETCRKKKFCKFFFFWFWWCIVTFFRPTILSSGVCFGVKRNLFDPKNWGPFPKICRILTELWGI